MKGTGRADVLRLLTCPVTPSRPGVMPCERSRRKNIIMKALILAAGYGTRLRPHTDRRPKPLFSVAGRPLLDRIIVDLAGAGCTAVMVNTHHLAGQIEAFLRENRYPVPVSTRYEPQILGTGGAISNLVDFWDDAPFVVINSDIVTDIDLGRIYGAHCRGGAPVTLVLVDDPELNSVRVDADRKVCGFGPEPPGASPQRTLTFTGIQVIDPEVLGFFPRGGFSSSIDAYRKMIAAGKGIRAEIVSGRYWKDVGTPERYRDTAIEMTGQIGYRQIFGQIPAGRLVRRRLAGDGSDRHWYRLGGNGKSLIMADHGITEGTQTAEVDAFVSIGNHLHTRGLPVPKIFFQDRFSGLVCLEDLGDELLQARVLGASGTKEILSIYAPVIRTLARLSVLGAEGFDPAWTWQTPTYSRELILENECRYFADAFVGTYLGLDMDADRFADEFTTLADRALENGVFGFMHRDFQSRNIMVKNGICHIIDFQGGRSGPVQYDLASLLIDPYTALPAEIQDALLDMCIKAMEEMRTVDARRFRRGYAYCRVTRNLQILGAFGFLSRIKGKTSFEAYIPRAVETLASNIACLPESDFPRLRHLLNHLVRNENIHPKGGQP
jgi:aminoglycoside/choline kinase family phosphotransferase/dTDP-glucose pyrophosphorylase